VLIDNSKADPEQRFQVAGPFRKHSIPLARIVDCREAWNPRVRLRVCNLVTSYCGAMLEWAWVPGLPPEIRGVMWLTPEIHRPEP